MRLCDESHRAGYERHLVPGGGRCLGWLQVNLNPRARLALPLLLGALALGQAPSVIHGADLFRGAAGFSNHGPACLACHSVGGLPAPNGGTLGPDLTHAYSHLGAPGLEDALKTLYFPAMTPLYQAHPLTVAEQHDLAAFLQQADGARPPQLTAALAVLAGVLFLLVLAITWIVGRRRLRGVRRRLVEDARAAFHSQGAAR